MKNIFAFLLLLISTTVSSQSHRFIGTWTKLNTTYKFEFQLILDKEDNNQVEGYFIWKVIGYDKKSQWSEKYYKSKINLTGQEFVKGTYNPKEREYLLKGYKKEDPHKIIGLDTYHIKVDEDGNLGGKTKANGTWRGRINGKKVDINFLL
jgi:hypothetical protein